MGGYHIYIYTSNYEDGHFLEFVVDFLCLYDVGENREREWPGSYGMFELHVKASTRFVSMNLFSSDLTHPRGTVDVQGQPRQDPLGLAWLANRRTYICLETNTFPSTLIKSTLPLPDPRGDPETKVANIRLGLHTCCPKRMQKDGFLGSVQKF